MNLFLFLVFISAGVAASVATNKLTVPAAITGGVLGAFIFFGVGWTGIVLMGTFFLAGTLATSWGKSTKQKLGLVQENKGRRTTGQVLANGGAGGLIGLLAIIFPQSSQAFLLLMAGAFSSAAADTLSSELGSVYGKGFYDILTLKKGSHGADGVISIEGILFGMAGSIIMAAVYATGAQWDLNFVWIVIGGTIGNLADSYLGATLERRGIIGNNAVNFLNTVVGAATVLALQNL